MGFKVTNDDNLREILLFNTLSSAVLLPQPRLPEAGGLVRSAVAPPGAGDPAAGRAGRAASQPESTPLAQGLDPAPLLQQPGVHAHLAGPASHDHRGLVAEGEEESPERALSL